MNARQAFWPAVLSLPALPLFASPPTVPSVLDELRQISIDPAQTYRVRDLEIARGDIKIYLTEGVLAFAKPVAGKTIAAVFTTANTEAGDAEAIVLPPTRSERASLAAFAKTPNLDERLSSAIFFFTDDTARELRSQMEDRPLHPAPEEAASLSAASGEVLRGGAGQIDVKLLEALLDNHPPALGFFYGILGGRTLGVFNVVYEPQRFEPVLVGRIAPLADGGSFFQVWSSFRPRRKTPSFDAARHISDYHLDTVFHSDLSQSSEAAFEYRAVPVDGRAISLELSPRLRVTAAKVDGQAAEFFQHAAAPASVEQDRPFRGPAQLLLVAAAPLAPETAHRVEISYQGSVVRRTASGNYLVDERNTWYPFLSPMLSTFDMTFHCAENLRVAATGELVSEEVAGGVRTVRRKTQAPEPLAGFNIGSYEVTTAERPPYRIELFANRLENSAGVAEQAAAILAGYTARWQPLDLHSLAISPVEGYFGQGFPGLIYLSSVSYLREEDRPAQLRNPLLDSFFSEMLLAHEIAHQWWGNMVSQADYRAAWLFEAMSNYAALEFLEGNKGRAALDAVLEHYRRDLSTVEKGKPLESAGPVDFGERLLDNYGARAWHVVVYEKGAWILHMLRLRLGDEGFHNLQKRLLAEYQNKLMTNDDFRRLAAGFLPAGQSGQSSQSDPALAVFFENWVYSTGIPRLALRSSATSVSVQVSGVDEGFALDLPLRCLGADGKEQVEWVHAAAGGNSYDLPNGSRSCQLPKQADYLYELAN